MCPTERVVEIQTYSKAKQWYHVDSKSNPADIISRGTSAENLISSKLWWEASQFLTEIEEYCFSPHTILEIPGNIIPI